MAAFLVVIPARFGSSRLPGKPLRVLGGKPMVVHVLENARRAGAESVIVATDDRRIADVVVEAGGQAVLTSADHASGTDRVAEVIRERQVPANTIVVNVQGDEPLLAPPLIRRVAAALEEHTGAGVATIATRIATARELFDPNAVKVVFDRTGMALYFSRAPIPWVREAFSYQSAISAPSQDPREADGLPAGTPFFRHIGLYAYRASALLTLADQVPPELEQAEKLEQLRALHQGIRIHVSVVDQAPQLGVDTEEDLARVIELLRLNGSAL